MSVKRMNVCPESKIALSFLNFAKAELKGKEMLEKEYHLYLRCLDNEVLVDVYLNKIQSVVSRSYEMESVMCNADLVTIVESFNKIDVDIDTIDMDFNPVAGTVSKIILNSLELGSYVINKETGKLELHLNKEAYMSLSDTEKSSIHSNFLFSKRDGGKWVSRAKFPNYGRAEDLAKSLGLRFEGSVGEALSFAEQMERKAERAEARADRYDAKSEKAKKHAESLQKPINDMHGDIAFFTQPNINSASGRAFTNRRAKMLRAYDKGFEEFKKSEYYAERAEIARTTAGGVKPDDKGFCVRRIEEANKVIKAQKKNLESYEKLLQRIQSGEVIKRYNQEVSEADVMQSIEKTEEIIEQAISKSVYYHDCLEELGGLSFSKENIKVGYVVKLKRWGKCEVISAGPKNISYTILEGGAKGLGGTVSYAEIEKILSTSVKPKEKHPFVVGDSFTIKEWDGNDYVDKIYTVVKTTEERVTLKSGEEKAISRKPRKVMGRDSNAWAICIKENLYGTVYKKS